METTMTERAFSITELENKGGPKRSKLYQDIAAGKLRAVKFDSLTRVLDTDWSAYLESRPAIQPKGDKVQPAGGRPRPANKRAEPARDRDRLSRGHGCRLAKEPERRARIGRDVVT